MREERRERKGIYILSELLDEVNRRDNIQVLKGKQEDGEDEGKVREEGYQDF